MQSQSSPVQPSREVRYQYAHQLGPLKPLGAMPRPRAGRSNFGAGACSGAGGFAGRWAGVPYLAMLLAADGICECGCSPFCDAMRFIAAELPCMLCGEPNEGVLPADGLMRGIAGPGMGNWP